MLVQFPVRAGIGHFLDKFGTFVGFVSREANSDYRKGCVHYYELVCGM